MHEYIHADDVLLNIYHNKSKSVETIQLSQALEDYSLELIKHRESIKEILEVVQNVIIDNIELASKLNSLLQSEHTNNIKN